MQEPNYGSVSLPLGVLQEIDKLTAKLGYWPSRAAFIREACLEKIGKHRVELERVETHRDGGSEARGSRGLKGQSPMASPDPSSIMEG